MSGGKVTGRLRVRPALAFGAALMTTTALAGMFATPAMAQTTVSATRQFDVPAQSLREALIVFSRQSGLQVTAQGPLVEGLTSTAVSGSLPPAEALSRLLTGTGLTFRFDGDDAIRLESAPQAADGSIQLGPVRVEGAGGASGSPSGSRASAWSRDPGATEGTGSYTTRALTIGKTAQSLREIPQSVSVITRQRLEDQNLLSLEDALTQSTGFTMTSYGPGGGPIFSRGFQVDTFQYDGVAQGDPNFSFSKPDLAPYDRVEVLRGAAGLLQGAGNPSAAINLVRKRPTAQFAAALNAFAGSWNQFRGEADVGGPLDASGRLRARGVVAYEDRGYSIDVAELQKFVAYGIVEFDLTPDTLLTVGAQTQQSDAVPLIYGQPRYSDGRPLPLPRSAYLGPAWNDWSFDTTQAFASIEHNWPDDWKVKLSFDRAWDKNHAKRTFTQGRGPGGSVDPATNAALITGAVRHGSTDRYGFDGNISGKFALGGQTHDVLGGVSYRRYKEFDFGGGGLPSIAVDNILAFDPYAISEPANPAFRSRFRYEVEQYGIYGRGTLKLADPLTVVLGGRVDWYKLAETDTSLVTGDMTPYTDYSLNSNFTPYVGAVWQLSKNWSVYASYADIFQPQTTQFTSTGEPLPPIVGANFEAGIKGELNDGTLNVSLAAFRIDQTNRAQEDLNSPCIGAPREGWCYVAQGKVRSQGLEAEISGSPLPNWQVFAGYTFTKTEYVNDQVNEGRAFHTQTPKHIFRLWTSYRLSGNLSPLSIGAGLNAQSSFYVTTGGRRAEQGSYALINANIAWRFNDRLTVALNGNNLFDRKYFVLISPGATGNVYGDPRNVMLTLRAKF